jgi:hypothetical protein
MHVEMRTSVSVKACTTPKGESLDEYVKRSRPE